MAESITIITAKIPVELDLTRFGQQAAVVDKWIADATAKMKKLGPEAAQTTATPAPRNFMEEARNVVGEVRSDMTSSESATTLKRIEDLLTDLKSVVEGIQADLNRT